jgi:hypothetical protein
MRWKIPIVDPMLPHQLRIVTHGSGDMTLWVTCNCRPDGPSELTAISRIVDAHQARVRYHRWHEERGIRT